MGSIALPSSGLVYADTVAVIYTVETYPAYWPALQPLWQASHNGAIQIVTSELTILEAIVGPLKSGDAALLKTYEDVLTGAELRLLRSYQ